MAQQTVTGTVTDASTSETLPGVNILVKGTSTGASTDADGQYEVTVESLQDTLVVSFVGYKTQQVPIAGQTEINVSLNQQTFEGEEIVVSGYQTQQRADVTGSISSVEPEQAFASKSVNNPIKSLQGQAAGVYINTSGDPSGQQTDVTIRGISTLNDNSPLYVIDGVPTKQSAFNALNPNDIDDIQVLKDAPSAAIYGSRASNGVIVITTKESRENTFSVDYSSKIAFSRLTRRTELMNPTERAITTFWANTYVGNNPDDIPVVDYDWERTGPGRFDYKINKVILPDKLAPGVPANKAGTDWIDAATRTGLSQEHNIMITTGGSRGGALLSGRFYDDQYIYKKRRFSKYQFRVNSHYDVFEDGSFTVGENLSVSTSQDKGFKEDQNGLLGRPVRPILPVRIANGDFSGPPTGDFSDEENPVGQEYINADDLMRRTNIFGNLYANIDLLDNLSWNTNFGIDWSNNRLRDIDRRYQWGFMSRKINSLINRNTNDFNWNLNSTLNYQLDIADHNLIFLAGSELTRNNYEFNSAQRKDFPFETVDYFVEGAGKGAQIVDGSKTGFTLLSFFGKVNYSFKNKYLASFTIREDGSSKFAKGNRFGTFPSVTVGWRIAQEPFMDEFSLLSELKLRAGWGRTGNQQIANDAQFNLYDVSYSTGMPLAPDRPGYPYKNWGTAYGISGQDTGTLPSGFRKFQTGNPELRWETTEEYNIGIDFGVDNNKIYGSLDYFKRETSDILIQPKVLGAIGEGADQFINGASVEVQGFELSATYQGQMRGIGYRISGNMGYYHDEITELPSSVIDSYPGNSEKTILGHSSNAVFGYVADGLFDTEAEVQMHADQPGKDLGRIRFKDLNGDGVINTLDQKYFGSSTPNIEYGVNLGLNYKGFDLHLFVQGVADREVIDTDLDNLEMPSSSSGLNYSKRLLEERWTPSNKDGTIPAVTISDDNNESSRSRLSSYFMANGAYTKLRNATLGYTFSDLGFAQHLRLYATGENLLIIKAPSFVGKDPERPEFTYPRPIRFSLGVDIGF